ncbi:hypothetical protein FGG79_03770 [Bacillus sp. BHET2]|uniref:hypothetical protein n=1 Tax=Bacillus sp. BHET2 TaxID=2583818 RepID=UPI00110EF8A2|nr:hypothetical protein [Bacillus sp. BHET2]TMU87257.1 hypothetical protein FGG79_03770 [Bacillus sp. BHET2]
MESEILRHFLATLSYRTTIAIQHVPSNFPTLDIGNNARKPIEILNHMTFLMGYVIHCYERINLDDFRHIKDWEIEKNRFYETLEKVDLILSEGVKPSERSVEQLLQGPFSDAMTHVGQLTLMRRLADAPTTYENFMNSTINKGLIYPHN